MLTNIDQQFAQVRKALEERYGYREAFAALSVIERHVQDMGQRAVLRVEKEFESGMRLPEGAPIYARETEHGWIGTYHPEQKSWSSHSFELDPDDFMVLVPAKARAALPASGAPEGVAREKGTEPPICKSDPASVCTCGEYDEPGRCPRRT